jgi:hypothetical protein
MQVCSIPDQFFSKDGIHAGYTRELLLPRTAPTAVYLHSSVFGHRAFYCLSSPPFKVFDDGKREKEKVTLVLFERQWRFRKGVSALSTEGQVGGIQEVERLRPASRKSQAGHGRFSITRNF